jgi:predicted SAM-dependent methyltransferase
MPSLLHIGCGPKRKNQTTAGFNSPDWQEIRLDIDPSVSPDVIGTMTDMSAVASGSVDAIFSSHNIEHLYPHEVPVALAEFKRVLAPEGFAVITCPDLKSVCALIADDKLTEAAYTAPAGEIAPIDILYGHRPQMARGNLYMAHRCGFTQKVLHGTLQAAGFETVATFARGFAPFFDLWAIGSVSARSEAEMQTLAHLHFPIKPQERPHAAAEH